MSPSAECACLEYGPRAPDIIEKRDIGVDDTEGRFADVTLLRCARCRRLWLRHFYEVKGFSRSGRWAEALIDEERALAMMPQRALGFIEAAPWRVVGGSYYGHTGRRVTILAGGRSD